MSVSKCPKCDNTTFEVVPHSPIDSNFKLFFVQCAECGCVVGTHEYAHIGTMIYTLARKLKINLDEINLDD